MSWQRAPLYVEAHDLALALARALEHQADSLAAALTGASRALLGQVACALSFPDVRAEALASADAEAARLRVWLALAGDLALVTPGVRRDAARRLEAIGRMLGGWRRARAERQEAGVSGRFRVQRGGSYRNDAARCRSAARDRDQPDIDGDIDDDNGFRVALSAPPSPRSRARGRARAPAGDAAADPSAPVRRERPRASPPPAGRARKTRDPDPAPPPQ